LRLRLRDVADGAEYAGIEPKRFHDDDSAHQYALNIFADARDNLSEAQQGFLRSYQTKGYRRINTGLRQGTHFPYRDTTLRVLDSTLDVVELPEDIIVHRIYSGEGAQSILDNFDNVGGVIVKDKAYLSTSLTDTLPKKWAGWAVEEQRSYVLAELKIPRGTRSMYLEDLLDMQEYEVLLPRDSQFRVVRSFTNVDGHPCVAMEMVT